jgi:hypothetical protein
MGERWQWYMVLKGKEEIWNDAQYLKCSDHQRGCKKEAHQGAFEDLVEDTHNEISPRITSIIIGR